MVNIRLYTTVAAFLSLALNGLILTAIGTSLPLVRGFLNIDISQGGVMMACLQAGFTIFSLVAGMLSDYFSRERILFVGCSLLALGTFFFCSSQLYEVNLIVVFVIGAGIGSVLSGSNTLLVSLYPAKKGVILNIHHIFFGLGSLLGPLVIGILIQLGMHWKYGFTGSAVWLVCLAIYFTAVQGKAPEHPAGYSIAGQVRTLLMDKHFWVLLMVNGLSMGVQVTIMLLGVTYLIEAKGSSLATSALALSFFSVCMMVGRLLCSRLTVKYPVSSIILTLLWFQGLAMVLLWVFPGRAAVIMLALSGLTFSGIYPTCLALSGILFPRIAGSALGILSTLGGLGTILLCWLTGYVADLTNMSGGFILLILASFIAVLLFQIYHAPLREREV